MTPFSLDRSLEEAAARFGADPSVRRRRSDRGQRRLPDEVVSELRQALLRHERPPVQAILDHLRTFCRAHGHRCPSRATVYALMQSLLASSYRIEELPAAVRETLYNLPPVGEVPGHQLAFHCFNYGSLAAMSFAAGLPWLALYQAARMRGWRPRSRAALEAVLRVRGI